jgi:glutaredoxin
MHRPFFAILLLLPALAQAQMYRWVDESGKVHYSDQVPPSDARDVQKKSAPRGDSSTPALPFALQQAIKNFPVTLYTSATCDPCAQARELLNARGVPYKEIGIVDKQGLENLKELAGTTVVPILTVGRDLYKGYDSSNFHTALDNAGYPRTSQLPAGAPARQIANPAASPDQAAGASAPK